MKKIFVFLAVLLVSVSACKNPFLKKMLVEEEKGESSAVSKHTVTFSVEGGHGTLKATVDGNEINSGDSVEQGKSVVFTAEPAEGYVLEQWTNAGTAITEAGTDKTYTHSVTTNADIKVSFDAPFIEGGASLILSPDKLDITVEVRTADSTPITVEGCTETTLPSGAQTVLHATSTRVILKGNITKLSCYNNPLTALNVQGLTTLYSLSCYGNQLTELNVQGCTALKELWCYSNKLNADAFKKLFDDLPQRADSDNGECILYTEESGLSEGNHTDFSTPEALKTAFLNAKNNKKWKMYKWNGSWPGVEI